MTNNIDFDEVTAQFRVFRDSFQSVQLATADEHGKPEASYAPCIHDSKHIYVFVSELSRHTTNLIHNPQVSLLFIEPENGARQAFARRRLSYFAKVEEVARDSEHFAQLLDNFQQQFGSIIDVLRGLKDFHLLKLVPQSGTYVVGFGKAFELAGDDLDELQHIASTVDKA